MERESIQELVIKSIGQIQELSGREVPTNITGDTCPIRDLNGFDSLSGAELGAILSETIALPDNFNPCVSADGRRALRVRETVDRIMAESDTAEGEKE